MNSGKISDWIQIGTGLALLVGLILVVVELGQARVLATIQVTNDAYSDQFDFYRQLMGENPSTVLVKACLHPGELTEAEIAVAMASIDYRYDAIRRTKAITEIAGYESGWEGLAISNLRHILSTKLGRVEYDKFKDDPYRWEPEIAELAKGLIESGDIVPCEKMYDDWQSGLKDEGEPG